MVLQVKHALPDSALMEQVVSQGQVKEEIEANVVVDEIDPLDALCQITAYQLSVVDQKVVSLLTGRQRGVHCLVNGVVAKIGTVAPQSGVKQRFKDPVGLDTHQ